MRIFICLVALLMIAGCTNSDTPPVTAQDAPKEAAKKADADKPSDSSTCTVVRDRKRYDLTEPTATWDDEQGALTITVSAKKDPDAGKPPKARVVLKLKDKAGELKTDNLERVTIAFEDFPGCGNESQSGGNTLKAITALSGSTKTGKQVTMEVNWTDTCEFKGKVVAIVK